MLQIHLAAASTRKAIALDATARAARAAIVAKGGAPPPPAAVDFRHFSGRGVRLRLLTPEDRDRAMEIAAREVGPDATAVEYSARKLRECVHRMIVAVTEEGELSDLGGARWMPVSQFELEDPKGAKRFSALFTTKDAELLGQLFNRYHSITIEDLDAIEGNAVEVSDAG